MSNSKFKTAIALAFTALLVVSGMQAAMAAQPSIDTETTNTTSTTELSNESTINMTEVNASDYHRLQYTADSEDSKLKVTLHGDDDEGGAVFYSNSTPDTVDSASDTYRINFSEAELADVPTTLNENVTLDFTIINNTTVSNPDTTTIQVHLKNGQQRSVVYLSDMDVDDGDDIETFDTNRSIAGYEIPFTAKDYSHVSGLDRDVDGSNTDVTVIFANDSVADDYSSAVASDTESGGWIVGQASLLSETPVKVYNEKAGDDVESGDSYGVYKNDIGGEDGITYELGDKYEDEDELTVSSYGNQNYDLGMGAFSVFNAFSVTELHTALWG